jgi:hypothetical protein
MKYQILFNIFLPLNEHYIGIDTSIQLTNLVFAVGLLSKKSRHILNIQIIEQQLNTVARHTL